MSSAPDLSQFLVPPSAPSAGATQLGGPAAFAQLLGAESTFAKPVPPQDSKVWKGMPFKVKGRSGKEYNGVFTHTIPNAATKLQIGRVRGALLFNRPLEIFTQEELELAQQISYLVCCLAEQNRPEWAADNFSDVIDMEVVAALYAQCQEHCAAVFRDRSNPPSGPTSSG